MKIAITTTAPDLDAEVDPRFGRCGYFLFVDPDNLSFEAFENANAALGGGAGIQSAQLLAEKGITQVLTGNCGPNAHQTLSAAGIDVVVGCSGAVRGVIEQYKAGQYAPAAEPNVASHFGMGAASPVEADRAAAAPGVPGLSMGQGQGQGQGRGAGRGMGKGQGAGGGRGRGMGRGRGQGRGLGGGPAANHLRPGGNADQ